MLGKTAGLASRLVRAFRPDVRAGYADSPCLLLELVIELADGTVQRITSNKTWCGTTGPILRNDLFGGEVYDARQEKTGWLEPSYDDSAWPTAAIRKSPGGRLEGANDRTDQGLQGSRSRLS